MSPRTFWRRWRIALVIVLALCVHLGLTVNV